MAADDRSVGDGRKLIEGRVDDLPEEHGAARRPLDASAEIGSRKGSGFFSSRFPCLRLLYIHPPDELAPGFLVLILIAFRRGNTLFT